MSQRGTGGVLDCGALEEDGPETCETLAFPWEYTGEHGGPVTNLQCAAGSVRQRPAEPRGSAKNEHYTHGAGTFKGRLET